MILLEKILEYDFKCPVCNSFFKVTDYLYEIPYYGKIIISSGLCQKCGYKWRDVKLAEAQGSIKITYRVESIDDLNTLVIKSSTSIIKIPELSIDIIPGFSSEGYITTVEGILLDIYEKTKLLCSGENTPTCINKLGLLKKALNGELKFTIEIIDPMGVSKIVSRKAVETRIDPVV